MAFKNRKGLVVRMRREHADKLMHGQRGLHRDHVLLHDGGDRGFDEFLELHAFVKPLVANGIE